MNERRPAIPLSVVGGFLGSGKTTLINSLLQQNEGRRLAVLVNDFGDINIDAELITAHDGQTLQLSNGCICCTIGDSLTRSLMDIAALDDPPDHLVIEASGVADPGRIAQIGLAGGAYRLQAICVLADAANLMTHAQDRYMGDSVIHQLRRADFLSLNKCDLVSEKERHDLRQQLTAWGITAPVLETTQGQVPLSLLLSSQEAGDRQSSMSADLHIPHAEHLKSWSFSTHQPLDRASFEKAILPLKGRVLRAKGLLRFSDHPEGSETLQLVGQRLEQTESRQAPGSLESKLVVIAPHDYAIPEALLRLFPD
ncbi:CobW family GTP-binding protein [Fodinicurvata sediminis]|uniref:CobW family GTP-binding protein n=1 Tax=Fodinicurvata sediminis TaxID=1121832 RepID=UPI0003B2FE07|nr:CobW family GTP-binding protein [Fodinicurvata sediminis]